MTSRDQRRAWILTKLLVGEVTTAEAAALLGLSERQVWRLRRAGLISVRPVKESETHVCRFQPIGLMESACYTRSRGALSCVTCCLTIGALGSSGASSRNRS